MSNPASYDVVAIGRPYTDLIARVEEGFVRQFGLTKGRITELTPPELMTVQSELVDFQVFPGGSPPNTAACIAALGGRAAFLGKVAADTGGRSFRNAFDQGGVVFPTQDHPGGQGVISGTTIVLVTPDDIATVVSTPGVSLIMEEADIPGALLVDAAVTLMQAQMFFVPQSRGAACKVERSGAGPEGRLMLSLHGLTLSPEDRAVYLRDHAPRASMIIGNAMEFQRLHHGAPDDWRNGETLMIMTDGANGAFISGRGEYHHIAPHKLGCKPNTVGAGDAFAAGFILGYSRGLGIAACGEFGAESAVAILEIPGARPLGSWKHIAARHLPSAERLRMTAKAN